MKRFIVRAAYLLTLTAILLTACKKEDDIIKPRPVPPSNGNFQFVLDTLPGEFPYGISSLNAVVSIANERNEEVVTEKMLTLAHEGKYTTGKIQLPAGAYKLTRFRLVYGSVNTQFATPMAHSAKASLVKKPLTIAFSLSSPATVNVPVEVAVVGAKDKPEQFGYPSGAFDNNQSDNDPFIKINVKAVVKVGDVTYDNIPGSFILSTWDSNDQMTTAYGHLKAGVNEIRLLKSAVKYEIRTKNLGVTDKLTLLKSELQGGEEFIVGGEKAAKMLKSEITYILKEGKYVAESKNEYVYDGNRLVKVVYYQKDKDNRPFLAMTDEMVYSNGKVERINHYNDKNSLFGFTSFIYNTQGKVVRMTEKKDDGETKAEVAYAEDPSENRTEIGITYRYSHTANTVRYAMQFIGGNKLVDNSNSDNYKSEAGQYNYDGSINPYIHMNWPDIFLSRSSKNNLTGQYKTYNGTYPVAVPYNFSYTYDGEGYPTELVKQFKSYTTNQFLYTTKTVYNY